MTSPTKAAELAEKLTPFDYLLNAYTRAAQDPHPAKRGYASKRKALLQHVRELEAKAAQVDALLRASEGRVPEGLPLAVTSSPATIWLDLGFDPGEEDAHFSNLVDVTWSEDNPTGHGIKYVRADLTAAPHPPAQQADAVRDTLDDIRRSLTVAIGRGPLDQNSINLALRELDRLLSWPALPEQHAWSSHERRLYEALQSAHNHIDMHSLEVSHCKDWARINDALSSPPPHKAEGSEPADTKRLDWLRDNSCDLRCFDMPTGAGDADIGWRVIEHHMAKPHERVVGEAFEDDPRKAIDAAIETTQEPSA